jgi:hypothetical protein
METKETRTSQQPSETATEERQGLVPELEGKTSRRQALILGLAAAPALLTLMRRPVWAQDARTASAGICASLAAASSLHQGDAQLASQCNDLQQQQQPAATTTTTTTQTPK